MVKQYNSHSLFKNSDYKYILNIFSQLFGCDHNRKNEKERGEGEKKGRRNGKKTPHCAHFIHCQCKSHANDILY